jgi:hypothetical protein
MKVTADEKKDRKWNQVTNDEQKYKNCIQFNLWATDYAHLLLLLSYLPLKFTVTTRRAEFEHSAFFLE